jgi:hypothetical protein
MILIKIILAKNTYLTTGGLEPRPVTSNQWYVDSTSTGEVMLIKYIT